MSDKQGEVAARAPTNVIIELTRAEALVLFEWLARTDGTLPFIDDGEQVALWRLEGQLETSLPELFDPDYEASVAAARAELRLQGFGK